MQKQYLDLLKLYEAEQQAYPPEEVVALLVSIQRAVDRAYQDGWDAAMAAQKQDAPPAATGEASEG